MGDKNREHGAEKAPSLIFTCSSCGSRCPAERVREGCACGEKLFKVAQTTTIYKPLIDDADSQYDPYRKKKYSPERGQQFNDFGGEGSATSTVGGPNDRSPLSPSSDPTGRPLPQDGNEGDEPVSPDAPVSQVADGSPLAQPTQQRDVNPFNFMRSLQLTKGEDPYELIRKRKFR